MVMFELRGATGNYSVLLYSHVEPFKIHVESPHNASINVSWYIVTASVNPPPEPPDGQVVFVEVWLPHGQEAGPEPGDRALHCPHI